ncbi:MAG: carbamoyltransferase N-terminal domain-containing protein, partial [Planctomycetota bacterium]
MNILGVTHPMSWNNAACLIQGGELVAMAEEERLIRVKYAHGVPPLRSIEHCLQAGGIGIDDVDLIAVGWDRSLARTRKERTIWEFLLKGLPVKPEDPRLRHVRHHLAHAVSAYHPTGWDQATIVTLDGSGEQEAGVIAHGTGDEVKILYSLPGGASFGYLYGKITEALGFTAHAEEGSVMALAAFGTPDPRGFDFVDLTAEPPQVNKRRLRRYLDSLPHRERGAKFTQAHHDLAATLQSCYTDALIRTVRHAVALTGCAANGALIASGAVDRLYVQPASHDAGTALGAAAEVFRNVVGVRPEIPAGHAYLGPDLDSAEVERVVTNAR